MFKVVLKLYFVWWFFNHISYFRFVGCNRTHQSHKTELRYFSTWVKPLSAVRQW
jgi:hypothetical protein